ncbi:hypothetical protein ABNM01_24245 [Pseudomonas syringae]|uniref:hypothetical protein n=1 Tax=Pseudomonas syringae group TaxID=136849 RepID=UPI00138F807A|nr:MULTISPECIES: hypothetical protein [Pseudomonas syringae group]MCQ3016675.1 hypothetical protein [Pseudomonas tremae]
MAMFARPISRHNERLNRNPLENSTDNLDQNRDVRFGASECPHLFNKDSTSALVFQNCLKNDQKALEDLPFWSILKALVPHSPK